MNKTTGHKPPAGTVRRWLDSVRSHFLLGMAAIILVLSLPSFLAGKILFDRLISGYGNELLFHYLEDQLHKIDQRYDTLRRVGLEDSLLHLAEIENEGLSSLALFRYRETGTAFVINRAGKRLVGHGLPPESSPEFTRLFSAISDKKQGILTFQGPDGQRRTVFRYYPPWESFVGISMSQAELFAQRDLFLAIILSVLGVAVGCALLFTLILNRRIIAPIANLTDYATRVAKGDLDAQPEGEYQLELAELKEDISRMVRALKTKIQQGREQLVTIQRREEELSQALEEIQRSEERYRTIFNAPSDAIFIHDAETGRVEDVNDAVLVMYGCTREEILGHTVERFSAGTPPYTSEEAARRILAAIREGPQRFEWLARKQNGEVFWVDVSLRHTRFLGGNYVIAVVRDIQARKEAERLLTLEKERLAVTLASIGDGVITTDTDCRVVLMNRVAEDLTGWRREEAAGRTLPEVFHIEHETTGEPMENPAFRVLESNRIVELENHTVLKAKDGTRRIIADSGAPIRDDDGNILGVVLVFRDMTEKHRTEQELLKVKKLESVGVLAGGIAHDFNNILAAVIGNIELASLHLLQGHDAAQLLAEAKKAGERARALTQQLLTFAKGGAPVRRAASITSVIRESAQFVLRGSPVRIEYRIPEDLWLVDIDPDQISQVIQNIVLNARQAMGQGGEIRVTCRNIEQGLLPGSVGPKRLVSIEIADTGPGIPRDLLEKIFDPYFTTKEDGSGLGLAICHSIVTRHDGHIEVNSAPGRGTTFTILLPASQEQEASVSRSSLELPQRDKAGRSARILVMDDEEMVREIITQMLTRMGHQVATAEDGDQALGLYQEALKQGRPFDVVIMDLTIPGGKGGAETARELLSLDPEARLVVASGYAEDPIMAAYRSHGFAGCLKKPFLLKELEEVLAKVIGNDPNP